MLFHGALWEQIFSELACAEFPDPLMVSQSLWNIPHPYKIRPNPVIIVLSHEQGKCLYALILDSIQFADNTVNEK